MSTEPIRLISPDEYLSCHSSTNDAGLIEELRGYDFGVNV